ncbi:MAG: protease inhibitor I42 family protein [Bacteroidetes bacterium]|nr:protease inhibitor I42 family protein [Bacteroidota bacterium]
MNRTKFFFPFLLLFVWTSHSLMAQPKETANQVKVNLKVAQEYKVRLKSTPSQGYSWNISGSYDTTLIKLVSRTFIPGKDSTLPGKPGDDVFTFKALQKGETTVRMALMKQGSRHVPRVEDYLFTITK